MDAQLSADASKLKAKEKKEWFCWWHAKAVCQGFGLRQNILTLLIAVASLAEIIHMEHIRGWKTNDSSNSLLHLRGNLRFRAFLVFRVACFMICLGWSLVARWTKWLEEGEPDGEDEDDARTRRKNALHAKAWTVQLALICTKVVLSVLVWLSYNVLVLHRMKVPYQKLGPLEYLNQQFSLVFMVAFFIIMNIHPLTFHNSLIFLPVAGIFMLFRDCTPLYVSGVGRVVFMCTAVLTSILAYLGEQSSRALFKSKKKVKDSAKRIEGILQTLMPAEVLETLHKLGPGNTPSHHYNQ
ncbi:ACP5, partial [Symbiodinium pilosum]